MMATLLKIYYEWDSKRIERTALLLAFLVFLGMRLFAASPYYTIQGGDDARYLALAQESPRHTLGNNELYLLHPPLYPYVLHFFSIFMEDHRAGLFLSLLSGAATFFLLYALMRLLSGNFFASFLAVLLYSLSVIFINFDKAIIKEPFSTALILGCLTFYLFFLKKKGKKFLAFSVVCGAATSLATDHAILLIPAIMACFIFFGEWRNWRYSLLLLLAVALPYAAWLGIKAYVYSTHEYYPAAFDGTVVKTEGWGFRQLLSSQFFPDVAFTTPFGISFEVSHYFYPLLYMLNLIVAPYPPGLRFETLQDILSTDYFFQIIIYPLLAFLLLFFIYRAAIAAGGRNMEGNGILLCIILFLIFLFPLTQKLTSTRFTATAALLLYGMVGIGTTELFRYVNMPKNIALWTSLSLVGLSLIFVPFYIIHHPHLLLASEKVVEASRTAEFLANLPKDGVMAQIGYSQELNYLLDKRVLDLPSSSNYMFLIQRYNINYLVYGEFWMKPFSEGDKESLYNYDVIKYIREHPEQFRLINVVNESYPTIPKIDHVYVYEVMRT